MNSSARPRTLLALAPRIFGYARPHWLPMALGLGTGGETNAPRL